MRVLELRRDQVEVFGLLSTLRSSTPVRQNASYLAEGKARPHQFRSARPATSARGGWADLFQSGDGEALHRTHKPPVMVTPETREAMLGALPGLRAFAISLTGNRDAADDLVQDAVLRAWTNLDKFEPGSSMSAWLFTILRNLFFSNYRKSRREVQDPDGCHAGRIGTPPNQGYACEYQELLEALAKLSPSSRQALAGAAGGTDPGWGSGHDLRGGGPCHWCPLRYAEEPRFACSGPIGPTHAHGPWQRPQSGSDDSSGTSERELRQIHRGHVRVLRGAGMAADKSKSVSISGAGPGGLAAALLLAREGLRVTVFEKGNAVGGRTKTVTTPGGYRFDIGPTFFLYPRILADIFEACGQRLEDWVKLERLDPQYHLVFEGGGEIRATSDIPRLKDEIARLAPIDAHQLDRFLADNRRKLERFRPILEQDFSSLSSMASPALLQALPYLRPFSTVNQDLRRYFADPRVRLAFSLQTKYLGMSPFS